MKRPCLAEQADEAKSKGNPTSNFSLKIDVRKKAVEEESRAASVYRERMWRPWRPIRNR